MNPEMPARRRRRPVTPADSGKWFEAHERGESLAQIARREDRDQRTIRKGIGSVQAGIETTAARRDAMRDALKEHFRRLIDDVAVLGRRAAPGFPPQMEDLWGSDDGPWRLIPYEFVLEPVENGGLAVRYEAEGSAAWMMLQSHLGRDPLWERFNAWKAAVESVSTQMVILKRRLVAMLEAISGFTLGNEGVPRLNLSGVRQIHEAAVNQAFGTTPDLQVALKSLQAADNGVSVSGYLLTAGAENPASCAARVRDALEGAEFTQLVNDLGQSADQVRESGSALALESEYVIAVPFPGGDCRACRRLGH